MKELFVLRSGTPLFYYSQYELNEQELDQSLLSSGLLSAISSFSEETRSSQIQSFSSEKELFVFTKLPKYEANLVGVFDTDTPKPLTNIILQKLRTEILKADIIDKKDTVDLLDQAKIDFATKVPKILATVIDTEDQQSYFTNQINRLQGVFLSFILQNDDRKLLWKFARPEPMFKQDLPQDVSLLLKVTNNLIEKTDLGQRANLVSITANTNGIGIYDNSFLTSMIASNLASIEMIQDGVTKLGYLSSIRDIYPGYDDKELTGEYNLVDDQIQFIKGQDILPQTAKIFFMTVLNNIRKVFKSAFNKTPKHIHIFLHKLDNEMRLIHIESEGKNTNYTITIYD